MFVQKIHVPKCHVVKKQKTDLQFLGEETHLQQRDIYKNAHWVSNSSSQVGRSLNHSGHHNRIIQLLLTPISFLA